MIQAWCDATVCPSVSRSRIGYIVVAESGQVIQKSAIEVSFSNNIQRLERMAVVACKEYLENSGITDYTIYSDCLHAPAGVKWIPRALNRAHEVVRLPRRERRMVGGELLGTCEA